MNDFGTVFKRTIGIDVRGFLIRMFPTVSYRQMRSSHEYLRRGMFCVLPLDVRDPELMMREVYKFNPDLIARIMTVLESEPLSKYAEMSEEEYKEQGMLARHNVLAMMRGNADRIWKPNSGKTVATDDAIILPLLYAQEKPAVKKRHEYAKCDDDFCADWSMAGIKHSVLQEYCAKYVKPEKIDFNIPPGMRVVGISSGMECFPDTLRAPGQRWSSVAFCPGIVPLLDHLGQELSERWGWSSRAHEKVVEAFNTQRTHSEPKTTFTIYF